MISSVELRVRYAETDQMGFVYHPHYLVWCEIGRTELIRQLGVPYAQVERDGVFLAVTEAELRYGAPARYDDLIRIDTRVAQVRSRAVTFEYDVLRIAPEPEQKLASARTRLVALNRAGAAVSLPPHLMERFRNAEPSR